MKTWHKWVLGLMLVVIGTVGYVYSQVQAIHVEQLSDDLYVLRGFGGNTAVLRTDAVNVIVDTMTFGIQGDRIRAKAAELTGSETALIINTHYHLDHTHGNPSFDQGTRVLSTERTLQYLQVFDAEFWTGDAAALMPNETFDNRQNLSIGGQRIELVHPGPGHTNGDLVVLFHDQGVIHMGDLMFNRHYPNIDLEAGGTIIEWSATLDSVNTLPFERVIPGHGATTDRTGIAQFQTFIEQLAAAGQQAVQENWTLEQMQSQATLTADAGYEPIRFIVSLGLNREFVLQRAWEEATGNFAQDAIIQAH